MTDERVADQWEQAGPARRRRLWLALVALLGICAFAVYRSALFKLERVEVKGGQRLTTGRIMEIAGLEPGVPRWERPAWEIEQRLGQEPWVKSVSAAWHWNRVVIQLEERQPVGLLRYYDRFYLALDEGGIILELVDLPEGDGLPVISGAVEPARALRGQRLEDPALADALLLLSRMAPDLREAVSEVHVSRERGLTLYMVSGPTVLWGALPEGPQRLADVEEQIRTFGEVWQSLPDKRLPGCVMDARIQGRVIATQACY